MLVFLKIENLALIEAVELEFPRGFITVTGETGAGKSILLGALRLLSGGRADKSIIRTGADTCALEAGIYWPEPEGINALLEECGLPPCEEGMLLLKRSIAADKPGRIAVNESATTLKNLQRIGESWIDFHGPEDPQRLFAREAQRELLDLYAGTTEAVQCFARDYEVWRKVVREKEALAAEKSLTAEEKQFLQNQLRKFAEVDLTEEGVGQLEADFQRISNAQELMGLVGSMVEGMQGEDGVVDRLSALFRQGQDLAGLDPAQEPLINRLHQLMVECEDVARDLGGLEGAFDFSADEMEEIQTRMQSWMELRRSYGPTLAQVVEHQAEMEHKLARQSDVKATLADLDGQAKNLEKSLWEAAGELSRKRQKAAAQLSEKVTEALREIGFPHPRFEVVVRPEKHLSREGADALDFFFSPNPGSALGPLQKIASSGEVARVMLALKSILADVDATPVLVFDEVDANVGGEIGLVVGRNLARMGQRHQVFCITHLPQVAGQGEAHFLVAKNFGEDRTEVAITALGGREEARLEELARMLGDRSAESARAHARELLQRAKNLSAKEVDARS